MDVVKVERLRESVERHGERFLEKVFTAAEASYCRERAREFEHLAARFAAKEAVLKALGTGMSGGVSLRDIEVVNSARGRPEIRLHGAAQRIVEERGITRIHLSLSHVEELAAAQVVMEGKRMAAKKGDFGS